jgi:hypothetical protein
MYWMYTAAYHLLQQVMFLLKRVILPASGVCSLVGMQLNKFPSEQSNGPATWQAALWE